MKFSWDGGQKRLVINNVGYVAHADYYANGKGRSRLGTYTAGRQLFCFCWQTASSWRAKRATRRSPESTAAPSWTLLPVRFFMQTVHTTSRMRVLSSRCWLIGSTSCNKMKDTDELIRNALADEPNAHPVAVVLTQLKKRRVEELDKPGQRFPMDLSDSGLRSMQQRINYGPMKGKTERERLTQYVEEQEKKVALMTPHCHSKVPGQRD